MGWGCWWEKVCLPDVWVLGLGQPGYPAPPQTPTSPSVKWDSDHLTSKAPPISVCCEFMNQTDICLMLLLLMFRSLFRDIVPSMEPCGQVHTRERSFRPGPDLKRLKAKSERQDMLGASLCQAWSGIINTR